MKCRGLVGFDLFKSVFTNIFLFKVWFANYELRLDDHIFALKHINTSCKEIYI